MELDYYDPVLNTAIAYHGKGLSKLNITKDDLEMFKHIRSICNAD